MNKYDFSPSVRLFDFQSSTECRDGLIQALTSIGCEICLSSSQQLLQNQWQSTDQELLICLINDFSELPRFEQQLADMNDSVFIFTVANPGSSAAAEFQHHPRLIMDWNNPREVFLVLSHQLDQNHLRSTLRHKSTALACIGDAVILLDNQGAIIDIDDQAAQLLQVDKHQVRHQPWNEVVTIASKRAASRISHSIEQVSHAGAVTRLQPFPIRHHDNTQLILDGLIGSQTSKEGLPDGLVMVLRQLATLDNNDLTDKLGLLTNTAQPFVLLLINPDNIDKVNAELGHHAGDTALREIQQQLENQINTGGLVAHYSSAVFSVSMPGINLQQGLAAARNIQQHLSHHQFGDGQIPLSFSIGVASQEGDDDASPVELFQRCNWALNTARINGGGSIIAWSEEHQALDFASIDRTSGKFSSTPDSDINEMFLQWHVMKATNQAVDFHALATNLVQLFQQGLKLKYVSLWIDTPEQLSAAATASKDNNETLDAHAILQAIKESPDAHYIALAPYQCRSTTPQSQYYALPLAARGKSLGVLIIGFDDINAGTQSKRLALLHSLLNYVSPPLDHALLIKNEQQHLTAEIALLDNDDKPDEFVYKSQVIEDVMKLAKLVAPTDANIMITGESGTGKELIAQSIHQLSPRRHQPFITIDCGTIVGNLLESELFGHVKGAFTGALKNVSGKILESDGGTLFLDEIGELPLETQVKLLRFVQERTFTAVGSTKQQKVDVRLIVATNRDLQHEVSQGRFREDLYYRINVINLNSPPLRDRGEDILLLAEHYIGVFCQHQHKTKLTLSDAAQASIMDYHWPGNVRELKNLMLRAVIVCPGEQITEEHIGIPYRTPVPAIEASAELQRANTHQPPLDNTKSLVDTESSNVISLSDSETAQPNVEPLAGKLSEMIQFAKNSDFTVPLGNWLEDQCLLLTHKRYPRASIAAHHLRISESTYRRKLLKAQQEDLPQGHHQQRLTLLQNELEQLAMRPENAQGSLKEPVRNLFLRELERLADSRNQAATLYGVSEPTYRRLVKSLATMTN